MRENFRFNCKSAIVNPDAPLANLARLLHKQDFRDGLLAILVFQYSAYEAGAGQTFWVKDRNGNEIPVITARYSIWEHLNHRARAGTPAKVAREIRQTVEHTGPGQRPRYDWVIAHVWSYFKPASGTGEDAENMPQQNAAGEGGVSGYSPVNLVRGMFAGRHPLGQPRGTGLAHPHATRSCTNERTDKPIPVMVQGCSSSCRGANSKNICPRWPISPSCSINRISAMDR
ncbi:MAG: hypothetical protein WAO02_18335 [Verrucomicrobiia bacterium]